MQGVKTRQKKPEASEKWRFEIIKFRISDLKYSADN
jgi:hypothetical protein